MREAGIFSAATLAATIALTSCGGSSGAGTRATQPAHVPTTAIPRQGDPCNSAKLAAIEIPGQQRLVCINGKWRKAATAKPGASCARYDPAKPVNAWGTLPDKIDCNKHTRRFVAAGESCDPASYRPTIGHLACDAARGKLIRPPTRPTTPPCKPGETRTLPGGLVEKCVRVPRTTTP